MDVVFFDSRVPEEYYTLNPNLNDLMPASYHCYGAAATEVEVDCLTGDHRIIRTDIVMDVGDSLNPAVDIGQVGLMHLCDTGPVTT